MNDRLLQLALFVRTVESGSFSRAARQLGLSQPAASRAIAALESRLGVKLIARTTRRISLTAAGEALLTGAREAIAAVEEAESAARGADRLSGALRVALPPAFGILRVVPLLPEFLAAHPLLTIRLMMSDRYEDLIAEGADVAVRIGDLPDSSFVARKLSAARRLFVASPTYLAERGAPRAFADLAHHDLISGPASDDAHWSAALDGRRLKIAVAPRVRVNSAAGVIACATQGLGIAVASQWMCAREIASAELVEVLPDYALELISAYVIFPAGRKASQKARVFAEYMTKAMPSP